MKKLLIALTVVGTVTTLSLSGCSSTSSRGDRDARNHAVLNLTYSGATPSKVPIDRRIIVLFPEGKNNASGRGVCTFENVYQANYANRFNNALKTELATLVKNKGFSVYSEDDEYDEIPFKVKKESYLMVVPVVKTGLSKIPTSNDAVGTRYTEKGRVSISGKVTLELREPLSNQLMDAMSVDLPDGFSSENYVCQAEKAAATGAESFRNRAANPQAFAAGEQVGQKLAEMLFANKTPDSTHAALIRLLNRAFKTFMDGADKRLQVETLLAYKEDVEHIKRNKRF